jgi:hypothetical protein
MKKSVKTPKLATSTKVNQAKVPSKVITTKLLIIAKGIAKILVLMFWEFELVRG